MDTRNLGLVNVQPQRVLGIRPLLAMMLATTAVSLAVQDPVSAATQDGLRIRNIASATTTPTQVDEPQFLVRTARVPIFVDIDLGSAGGTPVLPEDALDKVLAALDGNPRRLITLRLRGAALRFSDLTRSTRKALLNKKGDSVIAAYNRYMARQVWRFIDKLDAIRVGAPIAVQGLPFEGANTDVAAANQAYSPVLDRMNALVAVGHVMASGYSDESDVLRQTYAQSTAWAGERPIIFEFNRSWRIATLAIAKNNLISKVDTKAEGLLGGNAQDATNDTGNNAPRNHSDLLESEIANDISEQEEFANTFDISQDNNSEPISIGAEADQLSRGGKLGTRNGVTEEMRTAALNNALGVTASGGQPLSEPAYGSLNWSGIDEMLVDPSHDAEDGPMDGESGQTELPTGDGSGGQENSSNEDFNGEAPPADADEDDNIGDGASIENRTLVAGFGFEDQPDIPAVVGDPTARGGDCQAIARWDVVPWQIASAGFEVGVVAHHIDGIKEVRFSLDGGPWLSITEASRNPRTGVDEFWVKLPSVIDAGVLEIRAVVIPMNGIPRLLSGPIAGEAIPIGHHSMFLVVSEEPNNVRFVAPWGSDETGTGDRQAPFGTIEEALWDLGGREAWGEVGNTEVHLLAGSYQLQSVAWPRDSIQASSGWVTIRPAEGVAREDVRIFRSGSGLDGAPAGRSTISRLRLLNITTGIDPEWRPSPYERFVLWAARQGQALWLDNCHIEGNFVPYDQAVHKWGWDQTYTTNSTAKDCWSTPVSGLVSRNNMIDGLIEDAFRGGLVARVSIRRQNREQAQDWQSHDIHPDVWQVFNFGGTVENHIVQDLVATDNVYAQGIFAKDAVLFKDLAFVNVYINNTLNGDASGVMHNILWERPMKHVVVSGGAFTGGVLFNTPNSPWEQGEWVADDVVFKDVARLDFSSNEVLGESFVPFPDGPAPGWQGHWGGDLPWQSWDSGVCYE